MTSKADLQHVMGWLADLANMTAGSAPLADIKPKITTMAAMLADKFPAAAYCRQSLDAVASECRFFPPYSDVIKHLGGWWRVHRPEQPTIPAPQADHWKTHEIPKPRDPPTEAEKLLVGETVARLRMELASRHVAAAVASTKPERPSKVVPDAQLLTEYDRLASEGNARAAIRAAHLRRTAGAAP